MKQKLFIVIFILVIITSAVLYIKQKLAPPAVPDDFNLQYAWGACQAEWGRYELSLNAKGGVSFKNKMGFFEQTKALVFTADEIRQIYKVVQNQNFFTLNDSFKNPEVIDGSCASLKIMADKRDHQVTVANAPAPEFDKIAAKIVEVLTQHHPDWAKLDKTKQCVAVAAGCAKADYYQGISCETWRSNCNF